MHRADHGTESAHQRISEGEGESESGQNGKGDAQQRESHSIGNRREQIFGCGEIRCDNAQGQSAEFLPRIDRRDFDVGQDQRDQGKQQKETERAREGRASIDPADGVRHVT